MALSCFVSKDGSLSHFLSKGLEGSVEKWCWKWVLPHACWTTSTNSTSSTHVQSTSCSGYLQDIEHTPCCGSKRCPKCILRKMWIKTVVLTICWLSHSLQTANLSTAVTTVAAPGGGDALSKCQEGTSQENFPSLSKSRNCCIFAVCNRMTWWPKKALLLEKYLPSVTYPGAFHWALLTPRNPWLRHEGTKKLRMRWANGYRAVKHRNKWPRGRQLLHFGTGS